jgi:phosphatidylglycerophosphatase GEP4
MFIPSCSARDIRGIDFGALREAGFRAICFDKDNTLTRPYEDALYPPFEEALEECKRHFEKIAILSNSAGSRDDANGKEAQALRDNLGLPIIRHRWKKPNCGDEVVKHFRVLPAQIVLIGDRLFTDIYLANNSGMLSIHTRPISLQNDNPAAMKIRNVENWLLDRLDRPYSRSDLQRRFIKE